MSIEARAARPHNSFPDIVAVKGRVFWVLFLKRYLLFGLCESAANTRQVTNLFVERRSIDMIGVAWDGACCDVTCGFHATPMS